ncbi:hypothetical protein M7775_03560 [Sporomusa sphaeroides DSM 2875]|uniref:hypothetical protein n=1 Tax=Sporomusa sphaeroides TaxID=47679 RepID=UPI0020308756|nr:hypothetical protein [Sporomusa sphaeroides]MCM0757647.1 hypothetical protein [Sporomusa sphaeroides DSM 2875]
MRQYRVSIKFCGGCNPRIDRMRLAEQIRKFCLEQGHEVIYNSLDADLIVFLSGCTAGCSRRYSPPGSTVPVIDVNADSVDGIRVEENQLGPYINGKIPLLLPRH